jgi:hypothetical protein
VILRREDLVVLGKLKVDRECKNTKIDRKMLPLYHVACPYLKKKVPLNKEEVVEDLESK